MENLEFSITGTINFKSINGYLFIHLSGKDTVIPYQRLIREQLEILCEFVKKFGVPLEDFDDDQDERFLTYIEGFESYVLGMKAENVVAGLF